MWNPELGCIRDGPLEKLWGWGGGYGGTSQGTSQFFFLLKLSRDKFELSRDNSNLSRDK